METLRKILLYSNPAVKEAAAIRRAVELAGTCDARVTVMSVVRDLSEKLTVPMPGSDAAAIQHTVAKERRQELEEAADRFRADGIEVQTRLATGVPFIEVTREVLRGGHDLVILAADGRGGLFTRLLGSTSTHLMRKCPCPVWVIKPGNRKSYGRILAAVDTADDYLDQRKRTVNSRILDLAAGIARLDGSELHVLQVWSVGYEGYLEARGKLREREIQKLRKRASEDHARRLSGLVAEVDTSGVRTLRTHLKRGEAPAPLIVRFVRNHKVDLLVMGTVSRTGIAGLLIGNTAEEVLGAVECSVLTVKPDGFVSPVTLAD